MQSTVTRPRMQLAAAPRWISGILALLGRKDRTKTTTETMPLSEEEQDRLRVHYESPHGAARGTLAGPSLNPHAIAVNALLGCYLKR